MARGKNAKEGDTRVAPNGYHYTRTKTKWVSTGRLVAGMARGKALGPNERVKYKDGNPLNNEPDNLIVMEVKKKSVGSRRARIEAKIEELQNELELLDLEEA